jgi:hypothetical protein
VFPLDATETLDTDADGIGNNADTDDDGDGVADTDDVFPLDATETVDTDADGVGNNADTDDDGDGVEDAADAFPLDSAETVDTDADGIGNNADTDDDGDGVADADDVFPLDATETVDTDADGVGNNADTDDDGDGVEDAADAFPLDSAETVDTDADGVGNNADTDDDGDGVEDAADAFPLDSAETVDTDADGIGNNADTDDDGDGVEDAADAFPLDSAETVDTDADGIGNNADTDDDGDGVADADDVFPLDATETVDTDADGVGNNADTDDDGDGVEDAADAFPLDSAETADTDGDGIGNNADTDDDNDGVPDEDDGDSLAANPPVLDPIGNLTVLEGGIDIATITASDADNSPLQFTIEGADSNAVVLSESGSLEFLEVPDFESPADANTDNVYELTLVVSEVSGDLSDSESFTVTVSDAIEGTVVDAPVAGALVFVDLDGDRELGAGEPSVSTSSDGSYTLAYPDINPDVADTIEAAGTARIVALGGTDTETGVALTNLVLMSDLTNLRQLDDAISPPIGVNAVTTLLNASDIGASERQELLLVLGIDGSAAELRSRNVWADASAGDLAAQRIQRINVQIATLIGVVTTIAGDDVRPQAVTKAVVQSMLQALQAATANGRIPKFNQARLTERVLTDSLESIGKTVPDAAVTAIAKLVTNLNTVLGDESIDPTSPRAKAVMKKIQTVVRAAVRNVVSGQTDIGSFENETQLGEIFSDVEQGADDVDTDGDGLADALDNDDDGDGVSDGDDIFPFDPNETTDTDADGVGNNADEDDDNDSVPDISDAFPEDPTESIDTDGDGIGNNADSDDDNDSVPDDEDVFPFDSSETIDADGDGVGNNADTDDDNDGVTDEFDDSPFDGAVTRDTDGDGVDDLADEDDDGDALRDELDADADGDGVIDQFGELAKGTRSSLMVAINTPSADPDLDADALSYGAGTRVVEFNADGSYVGHGGLAGETGTWSHVTGRNPQETDAAQPQITLVSDTTESYFSPAWQQAPSETLVTSVLKAGSAQAPFVLEVWSQPEANADWVVCPAPDDCASADWSVVDDSEYEQALQVTFSNASGLYFGLGEDRSKTLDLSEYQDGYINFDIYFDAPANAGASINLGCWNPILGGGYSCFGSKFVVLDHSGWETISIPISDLLSNENIGADPLDLSRLSSGFELEIYPMDAGGLDNVTFRLANVELVAESEGAYELVDADFYSDTFDFDNWFNSGRPDIPVLLSTERRLVLEPSRQGDYGYSMMMYESTSATFNQKADQSNATMQKYSASRLGVTSDFGADPEVDFSPIETVIYGAPSKSSSTMGSASLDSNASYMTCSAEVGLSDPAESDCTFYSELSSSLVNVVDDTQLFGFSRSEVVGSWVINTRLTFHDYDARHPISEVTIFENGTAEIKEGIRVRGDYDLGDSLSEKFKTTLVDWSLIGDGTLVLQANNGEYDHVSSFKPMKRASDGSWRLMAKVSNSRGGDGDNVVLIADAVKRDRDSSEAFVSGTDYLGVPLRYPFHGLTPGQIPDYELWYVLNSDGTMVQNLLGPTYNIRPGVFEVDGTTITNRFCASPTYATGLPPFDCGRDIESPHWERTWDVISVADLDNDGVADRFYVIRKTRLIYANYGDENNGENDLIVGLSQRTDSHSLFYFQRSESFNGNDVDGDGVANADDAFPFDASDSADRDGDGVGDNRDAYPDDPSEAFDTDGDGVGNNADDDDDGDGVVDSDDAFPLDASESLDTDGDGIGNNADADDDGDGVEDSLDLFPLDVRDSSDSDGDGIGDSQDADNDNDGVRDYADAFPFDPTESLDTDGDGVGNNADTDDDGDGIADAADETPLGDVVRVSVLGDDGIPVLLSRLSSGEISELTLSVDS